MEQRHVSSFGGHNAGGIAGYISSSSATIRSCYNTGEVSGAIRCGGISGNNSAISTVMMCYNAGYILDSHGNRSGSRVSQCYNMGAILATGTDGKAGNISATYEYYNASLMFNNCYYLEGAIQGSDYTCGDAKHERFTPLCIDDFKTLSTRLNGNSDPWAYKAFLQGYGRPVLTAAQDSYDIPLYFKVADSKGDSVLIDLGEPVDNSFFTTNSKGKDCSGRDGQT